MSSDQRSDRPSDLSKWKKNIIALIAHLEFRDGLCLVFLATSCSNCIYPIPKSDRPKADGGASRQTQKSAVEQCRELRRGRLRGERDFCSGTHLKVTWKWKRLIGKTFPDMALQELFHSRQFLPKGAATQPRGACRADLRALFHPQGRRFSLPRSPRRAVKDQGDATEGRP